MAKRHTLDLTDEEKETLCKLRNNGKQTYIRERAAAMLKIASGLSPHKVAMEGLLKKRKPDTVYDWLRRFREHGTEGLFQKSGRGRKPAYAPKSKEEAEAELQNIIRMPPDTNSGQPTRWTLQRLRDSVSWLDNLSIPGVHNTVSRLGGSYKRGRNYIHSPDDAYQKKMTYVSQALEVAEENPFVIRIYAHT